MTDREIVDHLGISAWIEHPHNLPGMVLLRAMALARADEISKCEKIPEVLFESHLVLTALTDSAKTRTNAFNVADVLDAVVRILRKK